MITYYVLNIAYKCAVKNMVTMRNFEVVAEILNAHRYPYMHIFNRICRYYIPLLSPS
jgi:hypothetical protein